MAAVGTTFDSGSVLGDRFVLSSRLGTGASARVFLATDLRRQCPVAVKVLHESLASDARFVQQFERESRLVASLHHDHIVTVIDAGTVDVDEMAVPFIVTEYYAGGSLASLLDSGALLDAAQVASVGAQAAGALAHVHGRLEALDGAGDVTAHLQEPREVQLQRGEHSRVAGALCGAHALLVGLSGGVGAIAALHGDAEARQGHGLGARRCRIARQLHGALHFAAGFVVTPQERQRGTTKRRRLGAEPAAFVSERGQRLDGLFVLRHAKVRAAQIQAPRLGQRRMGVLGGDRKSVV